MRFEWEQIHRDENFGKYLACTHRAKVFGGWLVKFTDVSTYQGNDNFGYSVATPMTFIPDPNYEWSIE